MFYIRHFYMKGKKTGGRVKGSENKATKEIKEAYKLLIESNIPNLTVWLERVAETEPKEALKYLSSLSEYVIPKLGRTEFSGEIDTTITVHFKDAE